MNALVADFGTRAFWLGSVCTFAYFLLLAVLVLVWWLSRKEPTRPPEPRAMAEARKIIEEAWR